MPQKQRRPGAPVEGASRADLNFRVPASSGPNTITTNAEPQHAARVPRGFDPARCPIIGRYFFGLITTGCIANAVVAPMTNRATTASSAAYQALLTLLTMHGHRLETDVLLFLNDAANRLHTGVDLQPDEISRISHIRSVIARETGGAR